jgi:hypothetical protein
MCLQAAEHRRAVCWFRPNARRAIEKVRSISALLAEHGVPVRMIKTGDPGIVVYQDRWQLVAKPRRREGRRKVRRRSAAQP